MSGKKDSVSPPLPWKTRLTIKLLTTVTDFAKRSDDSVNRTVLRLMNPRAKSTAKPLKGVVATDVTVDPARDLWFRLYVPYPAQYEDGFDTLKFLDSKNCEGFPANADLSKCFLAGDSAGANISHFVARRFAEEESEFHRVRVVGLVAIQPFFGGEERTESEIRLDGAPLVSMLLTDWHWKIFLPIGSDRDHEACNVFGPKSSEIQNVGAFPATMVVIGGFDPLQDRQRMYYEGLKSRVTSDKEVRLVEYPNAIHAFYIFPELPEAQLFITEMVGFIRRHSQVSQG
ncbi:hypothetical protein Syun_002863 [Stephania yunnanensis]|uniref:Alpha/beta hydrolase fold-3 domain-containing protein n=1 Tax=Stephania yunnanensis TaxID=152371 RepID=A0AAP0L085_9MAGN